MTTSFRTTVHTLHIALTVALLAACAANLMLVCSWL
jgi:hypothetical protein